jgi:hypothetical protein
VLFIPAPLPPVVTRPEPLLAPALTHPELAPNGTPLLLPELAPLLAAEPLPLLALMLLE